MKKIRLCWVKFWWIFYFGWDNEIGTGYHPSTDNAYLSFKGYWITINRR